MIDKFVPDMHAQSIYRIDYESLKKKKIKLLIFDLDNTIAPANIDLPSKEAINLMYDLKDMGFKIVLMTNSTRKRVEAFKNTLEIDTCASSKKPLSKNYKKILKLYKVEPEEVAAIGDQLLTDVLGANRMGLTSILVNPVSKYDLKVTKLNRHIENKLFKMMEKRDLFKRGKYYE